MNLRHLQFRLDTWAAIALLVASLSASSVVRSQTQPPPRARLSVTTELVLVPVNVTDSKGLFVDGLESQNFRVFEDGKLQKIAFFNEEDTSVTVGLVVDHSRSMRPMLAEVVAAVSAFAHSSNPGDETFVVDFADQVSLELPGGKPFTSDVGELEQALMAISARGQTSLYDAVMKGLQHLQFARRDKKALIIVSDGGDNASRHTYADVLDAARQTHVVIYSIALVGDFGDEVNPRALEKLCRESGGISFFPRPLQSVVDAAHAIARDLREQYMLGYVPENGNRQGSFRKISVAVSAAHKGKLHVRTRTGYTKAAQVIQPVQPESEAP